MVPEGIKTAASFPRISAVRSSSAFMVGSSLKTSSPTGACAMASRISGVGRVIVSLRKSIIAVLSKVKIYDCIENGKKRKVGKPCPSLRQTEFYTENEENSGKLCQGSFSINLRHCSPIFFTDKNITENIAAFCGFC